MLRSMRDLEKYAIHAIDGDIGHVKDFYFDDKTWVIRYLVVDTSTWLPRRKVLVSPLSIGQVDWGQKVLAVTITKEQIKDSPDVDTDKPVSRQHEMGYLSYYGYPYYWGGMGFWGDSPFPDMMLTRAARMGPGEPHGDLGARQEYVPPESDEIQHGDPHLRSCKELVGYHIDASDGDIGHVHDFLFDEDTWAVRYFIVKTSNWWGGRQVLVVPQWIHEVSWAEHMVSVNLTRKQVRGAPLYDEAAELDREQEESIYLHYGRNGYWDGVPRRLPSHLE